MLKPIHIKDLITNYTVKLNKMTEYRYKLVLVDAQMK